MDAGSSSSALRNTARVPLHPDEHELVRGLDRLLRAASYVHHAAGVGLLVGGCVLGIVAIGEATDAGGLSAAGCAVLAGTFVLGPLFFAQGAALAGARAAFVALSELADATHAELMAAFAKIKSVLLWEAVVLSLAIVIGGGWLVAAVIPKGSGSGALASFGADGATGAVAP